ncbi:hypothetical protein BASA81_008366 [Batrachochytrium salamandrivorans]|nr:hypothetical protein BASA81_008366 [Batrachochytrium salamandrivorans]
MGEDDVEERRELRQHVERLLANSVPECAVLAYQVELERAKQANLSMHEEQHKLQFLLAVVQTVCVTVFAIGCVVSITHVVSQPYPSSTNSNQCAVDGDCCWVIRSPTFKEE